MKTKLVLGTIAALVFLGLVGGVAFAAEPNRRLRGLGKVTAVSEDTITVENRRGTFEVLTNGETVFRVRDIEIPTIEDIHVGDVVAGEVERQEDGTLLAKVVAVVPPKQKRMRGLGKVTAVSGDTITVENRRGTFEVLTNGETVFRVRGIETPTIEDIHVGDVVAGEVERQEDGTLLAKVVAVVPPKQERMRGLGKVTAVSGDTITVENRRGTFEVLTNGETVFRVRGVETPTIEDIHVGDVVAGEIERQEDGTLLAKVVIVVPPKQ